MSSPRPQGPRATLELRPAGQELRSTVRPPPPAIRTKRRATPNGSEPRCGRRVADRHIGHRAGKGACAIVRSHEGHCLACRRPCARARRRDARRRCVRSRASPVRGGGLQAHCASCHEQVSPRVPHRDALRQMPAARILRSLDGGAMMTVAFTISREERLAVSSYLGTREALTGRRRRRSARIARSGCRCSRRSPGTAGVPAPATPAFRRRPRPASAPIRSRS